MDFQHVRYEIADGVEASIRKQLAADGRVLTLRIEPRTMEFVDGIMMPRADAATFGAILFAYGYVRVGSPDWTKPFAFFPTILNGIIMTFVLLATRI